MRRPIHSSRNPRRAAAAVEFAVCAIILFLIIIGVFEYCRFIMTRQIIEGAAREGARYAVVNTDSSTVAADTTAVVRKVMAGTDTAAFGAPATVNIYNAGTGSGTAAVGTAKFGDYIRVQVTGNYRFILPGLLRLPGSTITIDMSCMMRCES